MLGVHTIPVLVATYAAATAVYGVLVFFMIGPEIRATMRARALQLVGCARRTERRTSGEE